MVVATLVMALGLAGETAAKVPAEDEYSAVDDGKFHYRGTSFGFGARFLTLFDCSGGYGGCVATPYVGGTTEFGWRKLRFAIDLHSAPAPLIDYDFIIFNVLTLGVGVSAGNERYRATLLAGGGYFWWGAELRGTFAPWRGKQGGRHGIDVSIGWGLFYVGTAGVAYRWFPPALNLRSRRRR